MALFKFSSRSSARHSGAQLRLAPNRPCMTLVIFVQIVNNAMNWLSLHARRSWAGLATPTAVRWSERFLHSTVLLRASCCVRYPEFGGCPLFRCCYCIKHMEISVGTYSSVRYLVEVRYWECPLIESPLYPKPYSHLTERYGHLTESYSKSLIEHYHHLPAPTNLDY